MPPWVHWNRDETSILSYLHIKNYVPAWYRLPSLPMHDSVKNQTACPEDAKLQAGYSPARSTALRWVASGGKTLVCPLLEQSPNLGAPRGVGPEQLWLPGAPPAAGAVYQTRRLQQPGKPWDLCSSSARWVTRTFNGSRKTEKNLKQTSKQHRRVLSSFLLQSRIPVFNCSFRSSAVSKNFPTQICLQNKQPFLKQTNKQIH